MEASRVFNGPALVVVDAHRKSYARYFGNKRTVKVISNRPLDRREVEEFRIRPFACIGEAV